MKSFTIKILGISALLVAFGWLVFSFLLPRFYIPVIPFMLLFFVIITLFVHAFQLKLLKKDIARFSRSNMLITFFKLFAFSVFAVVYIAVDRENSLVFVICLMILYIVFTFVEVTEITKIARKG